MGRKQKKKNLKYKGTRFSITKKKVSDESAALKRYVFVGDVEVGVSVTRVTADAENECLNKVYNYIDNYIAVDVAGKYGA